MLASSRTSSTYVAFRHIHRVGTSSHKASMMEGGVSEAFFLIFSHNSLRSEASFCCDVAAVGFNISIFLSAREESPTPPVPFVSPRMAPIFYFGFGMMARIAIGRGRLALGAASPRYRRSRSRNSRCAGWRGYNHKYTRPLCLSVLR